MHLALVCPNYTGHLNPMLTLGRAMARRGHRITLVSFPPARRRVESAGVGFVPIGAAPGDAAALAQFQTRQAESLGLAALIATSRVFDVEVAVSIRDLPGVLAGGFDAALVDQVSMGAPICEAVGMPFGIVCNALAMHLDPAVPPGVTDWPPWTGWLGRLRNRVANWASFFFAAPVEARLNVFCRAHGRPPWTLAHTFTAGLIQVAQQPAFFDFPRDHLADHFHFTGPWHEPGRDAGGAFPWDRLDGRPLVYASLGTVQNRVQRLYSIIARAIHDLDVQLVMSLGGHEPLEVEGPLPPGAIVLPYVPQLELLRKATAVITHAGLNTALEALAAGLPMVALPLTNDQPGNARRLAWLGVAELVPFWHARPTRLHDELRKILYRPTYRAAARRYQAELRTCPTVDDTARLVEWSLERKERLTRQRAIELGLTVS